MTPGELVVDSLGHCLRCSPGITTVYRDKDTDNDEQREPCTGS
jgi:hypothetical protein